MSSIPITMNDRVIPHSNATKHLGMTPDAKLRWEAHVKKKKTRRTWTKIQENVWVHRKKVGPVDTQ